MSDKIKAGCIVKTKFVKASSDIFSGYIDYIDRENAVRNDAIPLYSIYSDYMDNPEKTTDLFTANSDHLNENEKASLKKIYEKAQKNGSPMWQTVISFDNRWLEENGLYDSSTKILNTKKLMEYTRNSVNPMLKAEGLENAVWSAAIHYNTDNLHIHIASTEPIPTREKMIVNGKEEYRGKFKLSSIEKCKSKMVNQIIEQSIDNQKINTVMRESIINTMKGNILFEDREIVSQFLYVYNHMPDDKRAWKYGMNKIADLRSEIDKITKMWITKYKAEEYTKFKNLIEKQYSVYKQSYGEDSKDVYIENKIKDLFKRCGNVILGQMKAMSFSDMIDLEQNTYIAAEVNEANITGDKLDFDGKINYKSNSFESKSKYWTAAYKEAKDNLSYALILEDPEEKAEYLNQILNVLKEELSYGNDMAAYELGKCYELGIFGERNSDLAQQYYKIAFDGFINELNSDRWLNNLIATSEFGLSCNNLSQKEINNAVIQFAANAEKEEWMQNYLNYRVGSMLIQGEGVDKDISEGISYLKQSSLPTAQFTLGNIYYSGKDAEQNFQKAYHHFSLAGFPAEGNSMPFAIYNMAEMLDKGLVTDSELDKDTLYKTALDLFISAEEENPNDLTEYKIATMLLSGKGCDIDTEAAEEYLIKSSENGNLLATTKLSDLYLKSEDPEKAEKGVLLLQLAASSGNDIAQYKLGKIRTNETSKYFNPNKGIDLLEKAAEQENAFAQYRLGKIFYNGSIAEKNIDSARRYLSQSAENNNPYAQYALGIIYLNNKEITDNHILKAENYFRKSAEQGNGFALYQLGKLYLEQSFIKDTEKAAEYFSKAEETENPYILYNIGKAYLENEDIHNTEKAVKLFTKASDKGNPFAQYQLGKMYYLDEYGIKDIYKALINFTKSAEQGNSLAQYQIGLIYYKGDEIEQNPELAMKYLNLSAEQDNEFAQYTLGIIYLKGDIADKNIDKAISFFEASADQDNPFAQYQLGKIYYFGTEGIAIDKEKAAYYLTQAASQGNEYAQALLDWKPLASLNCYSHQMSFSETMISLSSNMRSLFERLSNEHEHIINQMVYQYMEREKEIKEQQNL